LAHRVKRKREATVGIVTFGDRLDGDGVIRGGIILSAWPRPQRASQSQFQLLQRIDVALGLAELRSVSVPRRGYNRPLIAADERGLRDRDRR